MHQFGKNVLDKQVSFSARELLFAPSSLSLTNANARCSNSVGDEFDSHGLKVELFYDTGMI